MTSSIKGILLKHTFLRRLVIIPLLYLFVACLFFLLPLIIPIAAALSFTPQYSSALRTVVFFYLYFLGQILIIPALLFIEAILGIFSLLGDKGEFDGLYEDVNYAMQRVFAKVVSLSAESCFSVKFLVEGDLRHLELGDSSSLVLVRHSSSADIHIVFSKYFLPSGKFPRSVFKIELLLDPVFDLIGKRLPNAYIDRKGMLGNQYADQIISVMGELSKDIKLGKESLLIYPEGSRFTPERLDYIKKKALEESLEGVDKIQQFEHVLPPRKKGILTLLSHNPGLDLLFVAHAGLEDARTLDALVGGAITHKTIRVHFKRIAFSDLPQNTEDHWDFILHHWLELDKNVGLMKQGEMPS